MPLSGDITTIGFVNIHIITSSFQNFCWTISGLHVITQICFSVFSLAATMIPDPLIKKKGKPRFDPGAEIIFFFMLF